MHRLFSIVLMFTAALLLVACDNAGTDEPMPEGTAPNAPGQADAAQGETSGNAETSEPDGPVAASRDSAPDREPEPESAIAISDRRSIPGMSYELPEGWSVGPAKTMRLLTLLPSDASGAELAVSRWPRDVGGFAANVGRWAGQIGTTPPSLVRADYEQLDVGGTTSAYIPLANKSAGSAVLVVWVPRGASLDQPTETWTLKLTCSAEQALQLEASFKAWAQSIKFE